MPMAVSLCLGSAIYSFRGGLLETLATLGLPLLLLLEMLASLPHMLRSLSCCSKSTPAGTIWLVAPTTRGSALGCEVPKHSSSS